MKYTPTPEEEEVLRIIKQEKTTWEDGNVWVTDKVQYIMNNVIKRSRKNYFGIFDEQKDPITGRDKIFIPMTEWTVESVAKNMDIDVKDINIKATTPEGYLKALVFRLILHNELVRINFGKTLNKWIKRACIDGTSILEAREVDDKLNIGIIDRLDFICDPSVEELDNSNGIIIRNIFNKYEFDKLGLENSKFVTTTKTIDRTEMNGLSGNTQSEIPFVEVFVRYGYLPEYVKTGKEKDKEKYFYSKAIVSGLNGTPIVHAVEEIKDNPFCVGKIKDVPNRFDGRGIPEMLFMIQTYLNEIVNTRMNKARIVHQGLFKFKGNVTPQQVARLFTTGGIKLDNISDIEPMNTGNIDASTYNDEETAYKWGTRVTGTTNEDEVAGNKPATNALIEQQGTGKGYSLKIEDLMLELSVFIRDKVIPIIKKSMKNNKEAIKRITGDQEIIEKLDEVFSRNAVRNKINKMSPEERQNLEQSGMNEDDLVEQTKQGLKKELGKDRFIPIIDELFNTDYDVEVVITDESINKMALAQSLQQTIGLLAQSGIPIKNTLKELYDTLGLNGEHLIQEMPQQAPMQPQLQPEQQGAGTPNQQLEQMTQ